MQDKETQRLLLAAAMTLAPTSKEQAGFANLVHACEKYNSDPVLGLLHGMLDGIRFGNWPQ